MRLQLGKFHGLIKFLYKCDLNTIVKNEITFPREKKEIFHEEAINCIIEDGLPFNTFTKPGMKKLLDKLQPGYEGPNCWTVN